MIAIILLTILVTAICTTIAVCIILAKGIAALNNGNADAASLKLPEGEIFVLSETAKDIIAVSLQQTDHGHCGRPDCTICNLYNDLIRIFPAPPRTEYKPHLQPLNPN